RQSSLFSFRAASVSCGSNITNALAPKLRVGILVDQNQCGDKRLVCNLKVARLNVDETKPADVAFLDERPDFGLVELGAAAFELFHAVTRLALEHDCPPCPVWRLNPTTLPTLGSRLPQWKAGSLNDSNFPRRLRRQALPPP